MITNKFTLNNVILIILSATIGWLLCSNATKFEKYHNRSSQIASEKNDTKNQVYITKTLDPKEQMYVLTVFNEDGSIRDTLITNDLTFKGRSVFAKDVNRGVIEEFHDRAIFVEEVTNHYDNDPSDNAD